MFVQSDPAYRTPDTVITKYGPMSGYPWAKERGVKVNARLEPEPPECTELQQGFEDDGVLHGADPVPLDSDVP